jgi:ABC-type nitrate/sulfonate/bicarbonate transport system permease component
MAAAWLPPAGLLLALAALWQLGAAAWSIEEYLLPSPAAILRAAWRARTLLGPHIWQTVRETLAGFGLALAAGLGLGYLLDAWPAARNTLYPLLVTSQTVPIVAIAPLLVVWFGYGIWPKVIVVGLVCFFPIAVSTADGLRSADPELIALVRTMGASRAQVQRHVRWPGALPTVFSGVRIAVTYSVVGAILGEWVGASRGLGVFMLRATNSFRTDWVFASIAVTSLISVALFGLVAGLERLALPWYYTASRQERWEEI